MGGQLLKMIVDGVQWTGVDFTVTCNTTGRGSRLVLLDDLPHNNGTKLALPCTRGDRPAFIFQNQSRFPIGIVLIMRSKYGPPTNVIHMGSTDPRTSTLRDMIICPARTGIQVVNAIVIRLESKQVLQGREWVVQSDGGAVFVERDGFPYTVVDVYVGHVEEIVGFIRPPIHLFSIALVPLSDIVALNNLIAPGHEESLTYTQRPHHFLRLPFDPLGKDGSRPKKRLH